MRHPYRNPRFLSVYGVLVRNLLSIPLYNDCLYNEDAKLNACNRRILIELS